MVVPILRANYSRKDFSKGGPGSTAVRERRRRHAGSEIMRPTRHRQQSFPQEPSSTRGLGPAVPSASPDGSHGLGGSQNRRGVHPVALGLDHNVRRLGPFGHKAWTVITGSPTCFSITDLT